MRKTPLILLISSFLLIGCDTQKKQVNSSTNDSYESLSSQTATSSGNNSSNHSSGNSQSSGTSSNSTSTSEGGSDIETATDLGVMTVEEAKEYILNHIDDIPKNAKGNGVDTSKKITIKAYALTNFDLVKKSEDSGLKGTYLYSAKSIMGDDTGYIACGSNNGNGTTLYGKIADHAGEDTSRYEITGFPCYYLGQPEISVPDNSFTWNSSMDISKDITKYYDSSIDLNAFYNKAKDIDYNVAGHGYGEVVRLNNLSCVNYDAGSGVALLTDGTSMIKAVKGVDSISKGSKYSLTGIMTTKSYSPAIRVFKAESVAGAVDSFDLSNAVAKSTNELYKITYPQDDTFDRFDNFVKSFQYIYKATVYIGAETHSSKFYFGFSDNFISTGVINGRANATGKDFVYVDNNGFWGVTMEQARKYNVYYPQRFKNETVDVYYMPQQVDYQNNKPLWKVVLLDDSLPAIPSGGWAEE